MLFKRLFMVMVLGAFAISAQGANLLTNGKFDANLTGWDVNLVVVGSPPADVEAVVQTTVNYDGSPALFMRSRTDNPNGAFVTQVVDVNGLTEVNFACVANKPIGGNWGNVRVDLNWFIGETNDANNWLSWEEWVFIANDAGTTDWDAFAHTFTVPATAKYAVFGLRANNWIWNVWIDNVFFGVPLPDQATLVSPDPGSLIPKEEKSSCGSGPTLKWAAAPDANGDHYFYIGTSFADVNNATPSGAKAVLPLATTSYTLSLSDVNRGQAYYWRVDETVNDVTV